MAVGVARRGLLSGAATAHRKTRPEKLATPGDQWDPADDLRNWLADRLHRHRLRAAAQQRRSALHGWEQTTQEIVNALTAP